MINTINQNYVGLVEVSVSDYIQACINELRYLESDNENNRWNIDRIDFTWWDNIKKGVFGISSEPFKEIEKYRDRINKNNNFINDLANTRNVLKTYDKETMLVSLDLYIFIYNNK